MWQKIKRLFQKTFEGTQGKVRKPIRVPSYKGRLIGKWAFWILFSWMLIISLTTVLKGKDTRAEAKSKSEQVTQKQNLATRPESIEFARLFAKEYFTWQRGEEGLRKRVERLQPYLLKTLDPQAGMDPNSLQWDANFLYAIVLKVEEGKGNEANVIFKVGYKLHRQKQDNSGEEVKDVQQQISIPIQTDGKAFVINGLPQIVKVEQKADVKEEKKEIAEIKDFKVKEEIREFLPTFFKSYTTATPKELAYVLDNSQIKGLEGAMKLDKVNSSKVYPGKEEGWYEVQTEVVMIDVHSETKMKAFYLLTVKKDGKQFVVTNLQNQ
ncbi:TPA: conjugal transfer protein [Bacillus pseudomycoides]|nr:conjugal transfer protein [Bacillus pseudomycoides]